MTAQLYFGRWQDALAQIDRVDAVITDPPYGARTHEGQRTTSKELASKHYRKPIAYEPMMPSDVKALVDSWSLRCRGWFVAFTSHDLVPAYMSALEAAGRYVFAPLPWFNEGGPIRLSGDGPSSWTCWVVVARPRTVEFMRWGTLPGGYTNDSRKDSAGANDSGILGAKPLGLMRSIVRDYSRPGDLVCDPFAGSGTTLLAALTEGRRAVGAEQKQEHYDIATRRLANGYTPTMFAE